MRIENLKRRIARWLGYGGIEYPPSPFKDLPIKLITPRELLEMRDNADVVYIECYGVSDLQLVKNEVGTDGKYRLVLNA